MPTNCLHSSWICSTKPIQQNFHNFNAPKIHSTTSQIANIAKIHDSPTLFKLHHAQKIQQFKKCPKAKITICSTTQYPKFQQEHTTTKWQCLNIKLSIPNVKFSISSFKFSIPNFKIPNFQASNFKFTSKFPISSSKFQTSKIKSFSKCERLRPRPVFYRMLGQIHVNGWSRVIVSQNGGSTSYIFPFRLRVLQWSRHLFNYWSK